MRKRNNYIGYRIKILALVLFVLCGCSTLKFSGKSGKFRDKNVTVQKPKLTKDVLKFLDLKEVDLDNDGEKEIVAIYNAGVGLRGVKVIKVNSSTGRNVIFAKVFNTDNLRFEVRKGVPTLIVKDKDSAGCGLNKFYIWDGKEFLQTI